jgi:hypothetical protein
MLLFVVFFSFSLFYIIVRHPRLHLGQLAAPSEQNWQAYLPD